MKQLPADSGLNSLPLKAAPHPGRSAIYTRGAPLRILSVFCPLFSRPTQLSVADFPEWQKRHKHLDLTLNWIHRSSAQKLTLANLRHWESSLGVSSVNSLCERLQTSELRRIWGQYTMKIHDRVYLSPECEWCWCFGFGLGANTAGIKVSAHAKTTALLRQDFMMIKRLRTKDDQCGLRCPNFVRVDQRGVGFQSTSFSCE